MILLDTQTLIWFMFDDSKLSARALSAIKSENKGRRIKASNCLTPVLYK